MYCQKCGFLLAQAKLCAALWLAFYRCENCRQDYLEVADTRYVFPLLLESGCLTRALAASEEELASAAKHIVLLDYKTVSMVEFERALRALK